MPKAPMARACLSWIILSFCIENAARAADDVEEGQAADQSEEAGAWIPDGLEFGGQIELAWERQQNLDLDHGSDDDLNLLGAELQLEVAYDPNAYVDAYLQLNFREEYELRDDGGGKNRGLELFVEQAYVTLSEPDRGLSLQLGRQLFEDERQWWYDADLDGARAIYRRAGLILEASASREALVQKNLLNPTTEESVNNYILHGAYQVDDGVTVGGYGIVSDHRDGDHDRPVFLGLQSFGTVLGRLDYWSDTAVVLGEEANRDLGGWGFDVVGAYHLDAPLSPRLILGYAFGSGDSNPESNHDGGFRQTGLQGNEAAIGGLTPFRYYGEAFDPELSNLSILTAGVGAQPFEDVSIDLVYHHYRQAEAADEIRDSALDAEPSGESKRLGSELDLVLGYERIENLEIRGFLGYFMPGSAFADDPDDALFVRLEATYEF